MKSSFSKTFFPVVLILLTALLAIGLFFQLQVRKVLQEQTMDRLENNARAVAELAGAYYTGEAARTGEFLVNISLTNRVTEMSSVVCDIDGKLILCAENPMSCEHQGLVISDDFVQQVVSASVVRSTGIIKGLYTEARNVVAVPILNDQQEAIGIVISSMPASEELMAVNRLSQMYLIIAVSVVLVAVLTAWYFIRRQSVPLRNMAKTARAFGHGELDARVDVNMATSDEVRELAIAFNNMASSLQQSENQRQAFVANVSHELKTPMTTISGFVDGILDGTIPPEKQEYYLSMVSDETKRLSRLVRSMLDISRLQDEGGISEGRKTRFDLAEAAGQVLITFEQKINDKGLTVEVDFPDHPVYTNACADPITQVIYNLVDNAVKFCPQDGLLGLKLKAAGAKLYFSVYNSGQTIPPQELPLVFERFHKLDKSRSENRDSWGLGLYIVKTIICSHGENISVTSKDGITEFTFTLPMVN